MTIEFNLNDYFIVAKVDACRDAYGTGDSPTLYEVELVKIIDDDGTAVEVNDLGTFFYNQIVDKAIDVFRE